MKKIAVLLLVMTLVFSAFAGCTQTDNANAEISEGAGNNETASTTEENSSTESTTQEPIELTIHYHFRNNNVFSDEWSVFKEAEKFTNVSLKGTASETVSDSALAFNTMLASGEISDIVATTLEDMSKYGIEGAFLPLNDLIDEHAPNFKKFLDENPDVRKAITAADGKIYAIANVPDGEAAAGYFLRTDWLEALDLEVPTTVDEYYNVLKAFKEQDPNGNGKADEIPFFDRAKGYNLKGLVSLFGGHIGFYIDGKTMKYGPSEDAYKLGMTNLAKWYDEGLIDPEVFTRGKDTRDILLGENIGGSTHDWFGSTSNYNLTLPEQIEGFKFEPFAPPADVTGRAWEFTARNTVPEGPYGAWGISITNPHPVETIKYLDFFWSEEGRRLMNFGVEGEHYSMVEGKAIFLDSVLNSETSIVAQMREIGAQQFLGYQQDFAYEKQWMNPIAKEGARIYVEGNYMEKPLPPLKFTADEQATIDEILTAINTLVDETSQKWILNSESVEDGWNNYVKGLESLRVNELIQIYQAAYDRYLAE